MHHELSRACVCLSDDPVPKVIILGRLSLYGARATRLHDEIVTIAAEWNHPDARGKGKLRPLGEEDRKDALAELEQSLATPRLREVPSSLLTQLQAHAARDVEDLVQGHLENRATVLTDRAMKELTKRGQKEAAEMRALLTEQRDRILAEQKKDNRQLSLFNADELRQLNADRRHWEFRLAQLEMEIDREPVRIEGTYQVKATRVEPVGLIYLFPVSN